MKTIPKACVDKLETVIRLMSAGRLSKGSCSPAELVSLIHIPETSRDYASDDKALPAGRA